MLQLILKDFRANWLYQLFSLVILFSISTLFIYLMLEGNGSADPELVIYFMVVMLSSSFVSLLFMKVDEIYHTDEIFVSLPVTRNQIVLAKYASSFFQVLLALIFHFFGTQLGAYLQENLGHPELEITYSPILWSSILIALLLFKSYAYPLYFKFGLTKGAAIHSVIQFFFFVIFVTLMINYNNAWADFQHSLKWLVNQNRLEVLAVFTAFFLLIMGGSMVLSTNFFKNKDI